MPDEFPSPDAAPAEGQAKPEPFVDRQLERALDVLRSIEVVEKYLKAA